MSDHRILNSTYRALLFDMDGTHGARAIDTIRRLHLPGVDADDAWDVGEL